MTERILTLLRALPRLLVPFVPLMMLCAVASALAALTVVVVHTNSARYHLTPWTGEAILLDRGEDASHTAANAVTVSSAPTGQAAVGVGETSSTH
jgi:hypothetical protein